MWKLHGVVLPRQPQRVVHSCPVLKALRWQAWGHSPETTYMWFQTPLRIHILWGVFMGQQGCLCGFSEGTVRAEGCLDCVFWGMGPKGF